MRKYVLIKADANDGDYVTEKTLVTDEQIETVIKPMALAIKDYQKTPNYTGMNWASGDRDDVDLEEAYVTSGLVSYEILDKFENFVPYDDYGVHTIEEIEIVTEGEKLL